MGPAELGPALLVALLAAYFFYYLPKVRGRGAAHEDAWRAEFGFEPGERLARAWFGVMYVGRLRPDVDYGTVRVNPRIIAIGTAQPIGMPELTGRVCRVALSERDRLAVSIEVSDDSPASEQLRALTAQSSGMSPLQLFGPEPRPELRSAEQAFSNMPAWRDALGQAPRMRGASGELVTYEFVHITGPELPRGVTLWLDPEGVSHLRRWSEGARVS